MNDIFIHSYTILHTVYVFYSLLTWLQLHNTYIFTCICFVLVFYDLTFTVFIKSLLKMKMSFCASPSMLTIRHNANLFVDKMQIFCE